MPLDHLSSHIYFLIDFNVILPSVLRSSKMSLLCFSEETECAVLVSAISVRSLINNFYLNHPEDIR
jgi:hypothetical protein